MPDKEASYQSLFEKNTDGVFLLDHEGRFVAVNRAAEKISGYTAQEVEGRTFRDLCALDQLEKSEQAFQLALSGKTHELETAFIRKDGLRREILLTGGPVVISGSISGLFVMIKDITDRKREHAEQKRVLEAQVKERTAALCQAIQKLETEIAQREAAEQVLRENSQQLRFLAAELTLAEQRERERLARVLHDDLQQILVATRMRLDCAEADTPGALGLLDQAIGIARSLSAELSPPILRQGGIMAVLRWLAGWMQTRYGLSISVSASDEMEPLSYEMTVFLFQAVRELLFNVLKHSGTRSAWIEVSLLQRRLSIIVEDQGVGFDPGQLRAELGSAAGFGLLSIRERIKSFGGKLFINSSPGQGSRFVLVFTLKQPHEELLSGLTFGK